MDFTQTKQYEKAYKHFLKTKQDVSDANLTPFRIQEKKYKSKFPPPTLKDVLNPWACDDLLRQRDGFNNKWETGETSEIPLKINKIRLKTDHGSHSSNFAILIPSCPGLVIIPAFLSEEEQRSLIRSSLRGQARAPNETNLDTHYHIPEAGIWNIWTDNKQESSNHSDTPSILPKSTPGGSGFRAEPPSRRTLVENESGSVKSLSVSEPLPDPTPSSTVPPLTLSQAVLKLRWANIGRSYHWGTKSYDFNRKLAPFPEDVRDICKNVVKQIPWDEVWSESNATVKIPEEEWGEEGSSYMTWAEEYEPDAGIVNFYQWNDTLMGHVDRSEVSSTTPLVSISLGNAAVFLIGGATRNEEPIPILLRSGDVVVMSGPRCRRAYHGVPRILEGTCPSYLSNTDSYSTEDDNWMPYAKYMETTRININVRQVFPKGFVMPSHVATTSDE